MSSRRILFVTEGRRDEPRFLNHMMAVLFNTKPENIFYYEANIHRMMMNTPPDEYVNGDYDTVQILREDAHNRNKSFPEGEFSDVFLIFDMDPHDQKYDGGKHLQDASIIFTESSERGKLFLNYPMMQSYKHICPDDDYLGKMVSIDVIRQYKNIVDSECPDHLKHLSRYDENTLFRIIALNLKKADLISGKDGTIRENTYMDLDPSTILSVQIDKFAEESSVFVLNTAVFIPLELSSKMMPKLMDFEMNNHDQ